MSNIPAGPPAKCPDGYYRACDVWGCDNWRARLAQVKNGGPPMTCRAWLEAKAQETVPDALHGAADGGKQEP